MGKKDLVSIVVLNWNGEKFLETCLRSIMDQTYEEKELIIIDNGSSDSSPQVIDDFSKKMPCQIVLNEKNMGFSRAMNQGIHLTKGEFILLCNLDIKLFPNYVEEAVAAMNKDPSVGSVSGKLIAWKEEGKKQTLDSTGLFLDYFRTPIERGQGEEDKGQYDRPSKIFCACGALPLYRKKMLEEIRYESEYFDDVFFAYYEDIDLGWRGRIAGWEAVYWPTATAFHYRGGANKIRGNPHRTKISTAQKEAIKNRYLMLLKNEDMINFLFHFPLFFTYEVLRFIYMFLKYPGLLVSFKDVIPFLPCTLTKRGFVKDKKKVSASQIRHFIGSRNNKFYTNKYFF